MRPTILGDSSYGVMKGGCEGLSEQTLDDVPVSVDVHGSVLYFARVGRVV